MNNKRFIFKAIDNNDLDTLKQLLEKDNLDKEKIFTYASEKGHLEVVKFLHSIGMPISKEMIGWGICYRQFEVVDFLNSVGSPSNTDDAMKHAICSNNLELVKLLYIINTPLSEWMIELANDNGNLEIVEFLKSKSLK